MYGSLEGSLESTSAVRIRSTGVVAGTVVYKRMVRLFVVYRIDRDAWLFGVGFGVLMPRSTCAW